MSGAKDEGLLGILHANRRGVLASIQVDGRPHQSVLDYTYDPETNLIRMSTTDGRAKVRNMRHDPRVSLHVGSPDLSEWVVAEGTVDLTPSAKTDHDATVEELVDVYRAIQGEHPDWDDYRRAMVADGRLVVRIWIERVYGMAR